MTPAALHRAILRIAALLVPETQRPDWLAEWRSELWHIRRDPHGQNIAAFCMGAFRDAFWIRRHGPKLGPNSILCLYEPPTPETIDSFPDQGEPLLSSPVSCLSWLAALGTLCAVVALLLPAAGTLLLSSTFSRNLILLSPAEYGDPSIQNGFMDPYPTVSRALFESLKTRDGEQFTGLAFYTLALMPVETPAGRRMLTVARATADLNFFVPAGAVSNLPGRLDRWFIEDKAASSTLGFVVGRLRYATLRDNRFHFIRLPDRSLQIFSLIPVVFVFACILVATMPSRPSGGHLRGTGARRTLFLAAKALLVMPIVLFGSLDLATLAGSVKPLFFVTALASVFAARWTLADQRNRCPVCLRLLANPVRIGEASRILLEWQGTELMCLRGHGVLYVPERPAIWSARQNWIALGPSWAGLFPRRGPAKAIHARHA